MLKQCDGFLYKTNTEGSIIAPIALFYGCIINIPDSMGLPQYFQVIGVSSDTVNLEPHCTQSLTVQAVW
jgi:hypothetical protein